MKGLTCMIKTKLDFLTEETKICYASIELDSNVIIVYKADEGREIHLIDKSTDKAFSLPFKEFHTAEEIKQYGLDMLDLFKNMRA